MVRIAVPGCGRIGPMPTPFETGVAPEVGCEDGRLVLAAAAIRLAADDLGVSVSEIG